MVVTFFVDCGPDCDLAIHSIRSVFGWIMIIIIIDSVCHMLLHSSLKGTVFVFGWEGIQEENLVVLQSVSPDGWTPPIDNDGGVR